MNFCINLAFASSPPGAFPLRQIGGSTPFIDKLVIVFITNVFNANAFAKVEIAEIFSDTPGTLITASPIGTFVSMFMSTNS